MSAVRKCASFALALGLALAALGCDRNVEPYVPGETAAPPDLRKIFPPGAEQSERQMAAAAGGSEGAPAESRGNMPPAAPPPAPGAAPAAEAAAETAPVSGVVRLAPELAGRVPANGVLFIVARRGGAGPPLAVKRIESPTFPLAFELGPDDRMIQAMPFAGPLQLTARVDGDGNATTRTPGDLQGAAPAPVDPGATNVEIVLGEVL